MAWQTLLGSLFVTIVVAHRLMIFPVTLGLRT